MENLLYIYAVVVILLWLAGIAVLAVTIHLLQNKNKFSQPKFWIENTGSNKIHNTHFGNT